MTPFEFSKGLMKLVVEDGVDDYQDMFTLNKPEDSSDPYGKRALSFFQGLSTDQRSAFFEIIRQVSVDTVASVLAVIDGVSFIEGAAEEFTLLYGRNQRLNGDLQSLFLIEDERQIR